MFKRKKMKFFNLLMLTVIAVGFFTACKKDTGNFLSPEDQTAVAGMKEAYENASNENNLFNTAVTDNDAVAIHRHDSLFYCYEEMFDEYHSHYSHVDGHTDHYHDAMGMHMMGGGMGHMHDMWADGHYWQDHEMMDELVDEHETLKHQISN